MCDLPIRVCLRDATALLEAGFDWILAFDASSRSNHESNHPSGRQFSGDSSGSIWGSFVQQPLPPWRMPPSAVSTAPCRAHERFAQLARNVVRELDHDRVCLVFWG